ncbi:MAG: hypothetical protein AAF125_05135 [Chloroflexota bacterium]
MDDLYHIYFLSKVDPIAVEAVFLRAGYQVTPADSKAQNMCVYVAESPLEATPPSKLWFQFTTDLSFKYNGQDFPDNPLGWEFPEPEERYWQLRPKTVMSVRQHLNTEEALPYYRTLIRAFACWISSPYTDELYTLKNLDEMPADERTYSRSV